MTVLFIKKLLSLIFPPDDNRTFLEPFMQPNGKYFEYRDDNYTVQARIKVIKK
jgi:hypothetical protein